MTKERLEMTPREWLLLQRLERLRRAVDDMSDGEVEEIHSRSIERGTYEQYAELERAIGKRWEPGEKKKTKES